VTQLACFCELAGKMHWATLHHLMEYLDAHSSFKLTYRKRSALSNGLIGFADSDWAMSLLRRSTPGNLFLSLADFLATEAAEHDCYVNSRGGVLLSIHGGG
jgi:hypothetical protein